MMRAPGNAADREAAEHGEVDAGQLCGGVDAELVGEGGAYAFVDGQGVCLAAVGV